VLDYVLDDLDLLLIMTVNPGFGGQQFVPATMRKINAARAMLNAHNRVIDLEVDGDIGPHNAAEVCEGRGECVGFRHRHFYPRRRHFRRRPGNSSCYCGRRIIMIAPDSSR